MHPDRGRLSKREEDQDRYRQRSPAAHRRTVTERRSRSPCSTADSRFKTPAAMPARPSGRKPRHGHNGSSYRPEYPSNAHDHAPRNQPARSTTPLGGSESSSNNERSMPKHFSPPLTCFYWSHGHCTKSNEACIYAHWDTGVVANAPISVGSNVVAGNNADRALGAVRNLPGDLAVSLGAKEQALKQRQAALDKREKALNGREAALMEREDLIAQLQEALSQAHGTIKQLQAAPMGGQGPEFQETLRQSGEVLRQLHQEDAGLRKYGWSSAADAMSRAPAASRAQPKPSPEHGFGARKPSG